MTQQLKDSYQRNDVENHEIDPLTNRDASGLKKEITVFDLKQKELGASQETIVGL